MKYASSPFQNPIPIQYSDNHELIFNHHEENKKNTVFNQLSHAVYSHLCPDGKCSGKGWACTPHTHQPGLISPSWSLLLYVLCVWNHRVHRVATVTFWRTFHPNGKISPGWWGWGVLLYLPSCIKLWCTLQMRGQIHSFYFYTTPICTLCVKQ